MTTSERHAAVGGDRPWMAEAASSSLSTLLDDYSLEMTAKDVVALLSAAPMLPSAARMNVTFLGSEDLAMRLYATRAIAALDLTPIAHISARRLGSEEALRAALAALEAQSTVANIFAVGGDPHTPEGPYASSLDVIRSGLLPGYGVKEVSIAGYPEGHPDISDGDLWAALEAKVSALQDQGLSGAIITQFGFDTAPITTWIERVRDRGIDLPIRIGVPGPAGVKRLLAFARRFGVGANAMIVRKCGFSLANLVGTAGPDRFVRDLAVQINPARHGIVKLHFYTFGGVEATAKWISNLCEELQ